MANEKRTHVPWSERFSMDRQAAAWLDADGRHVWFRHQCAIACDCPDHTVTTMLPYPTWRADESMVAPSIACGACGFHERLPLREVA